MTNAEKSNEFAFGEENSFLVDPLANPLENNLGLGISPNNNPQYNPFKLGNSSLSVVEQFFQQEQQNSQRTAAFNNNNSSSIIIGETPYFAALTAPQSDPLTGNNNSLNTPQSDPLIDNKRIVEAPFFAVKAGGTVKISGSSDFDGEATNLEDDAFIYGGKGFQINGNSLLPVERDSEGNPLTSGGKYILRPKAVAVAEGHGRTSGPSKTYIGISPPQTVSRQEIDLPLYGEIREREISRRIPLGASEFNFNVKNNSLKDALQWVQKFPVGGSEENPVIIRVTGGKLDIPSQVSLNNCIIIVESGDITFKGSGHKLNNVVLVANNGSIKFTAVSGENIAIFADKSISVGAQVNLTGDNLLGNRQGTISFQGNVAVSGESDSLRAFSSGDLNFNGTTRLRGTLASGKNLTLKGNSTVWGTLAAKGNISLNGTTAVIYPDAKPPFLTATLAKDTGTGGDGITFDPGIVGNFGDDSEIVELRASFGNSSESEDILDLRLADGSFNLTRERLEAIYGGSLPEGQHNLQLTAVDLFGNRAELAVGFVLDTELPQLLLNSPNFDAPLTDKSRLTGTASDFGSGVATLEYRFDDLPPVSLNLVGDSFDAAIDYGGVANGERQLTITATDAAGNSYSHETTVTVNLDREAPLLTVGLVEDTGAMGDNITSKPALSGKAIDAEAIVSLEARFDDGESWQNILPQLQPDGTFKLEREQLEVLAGKTLLEGEHTLYLQAKDEYGNSSPILSFSFTLDLTAPIAPVLQLAGSGLDRLQTVASSATLRGMVEPHAEVVLLERGLQAIADAAGEFRFEDFALQVGVNALSFKVTDLAGNSQIWTNTIVRQSQSDVVLDWNALVLQAIQKDRTAPPLAARNLAIVHSAIYDAVNAIERDYRVYRVDATAPEGANIEAAAVGAAHRTLLSLYPLQKDSFDNALVNSLAALADGAAESDGLALGIEVAEAILAERQHDGATVIPAYSPSTEAGRWQPTPGNYSGALLPQWGTVTPFTMTSGSQFRPLGPNALSGEEYAAEFQQVKELGSANSTIRTPEQTQIAKFWSDEAGTYTPPGHWNEIAATAVFESGKSSIESARLFALLNLGLADAGIVSWDAKYTYNSWRPITAIREADRDDNPLTDAETGWTSLLATPPFPEYTSGHSTFSGAAETILTGLLGDNSQFTASSFGVPTVTRNFSSFSAAAAEAGISRIYGGIHFNQGNLDGLASGRALGDYILDNFLAPEDLDPLIRVDLLEDSAPLGTNRDGITNNSTLTGTATLVAGRRLMVGLVGSEGVDYRDLTSLVDADGEFTLDTAALEQIWGRSLLDGDYSFEFRLEDALGTILGRERVDFTLITGNPDYRLDWPTATGDYSSTVRLQGGSISRPLGSVRYSLDGGVRQTIAVDSSGNFNAPIASQGLEAGAHRLAIELFDLAGNKSDRTVDFSVTDDFEIAAADGLAGWGRKTDAAVMLSEGDSFSTQTTLSVALGGETGTRKIEFDLDASFDFSDLDTGAGDRLMVYLVADSSPINLDDSWLTPDGQPIFTLGEGGAAYIPGLVAYDGRRVSIDVSSLKNETRGKLVLQLIGQDRDDNTTVSLSNLLNESDPEGISSPLDPPKVERASRGDALSLDGYKLAANASLVLSNLKVNPQQGKYTADLQIKNNGTDKLPSALAVLLPDLPAGVEILDPSGVDLTGVPYLNFRSTVPAGGLVAGAVSAAISIEIANPNLLRFDLQGTILTGLPDRPPSLDALGTLDAVAGGRLEVPLVGSDLDGDPVTFSLKDGGDLPDGKLTADGRLIFTPSPQQVGSYRFTLVATSGGVETSQQVTLNVRADSATTTRIRGTILDVDRSPLEGVVVELGGWQTTTTADGSFLLEFARPLTSDTLKIRGERLQGEKVYPFIAEKLPLILEREVYEGSENIIARPIYLPPLDVASGRQIDPALETVVTSEKLLGSAVTVKAGSLFDQKGSLFRGTLSITEVPASLTPAALPANLSPDLVVTVQPGEMVFTSPAPLSLPNSSGWGAGMTMDLWSINPVTGDFDKVGVGKVSADGKVVETISGGIRNSSWHFFATVAAGFTNNSGNSDCPECSASKHFSSEVELHSGVVIETHNTVTYSSNDENRSITLTYDSLRADPRPIVNFSLSDLNPNEIAPGFTDKLRLMAKLTLQKDGFNYQVPGFSGGRYGLSGGEHFWSIPNSSGEIEAGLPADLRNMASGKYDYTLQSGIRLFVRDQLVGTSSEIKDKILHVNSIDSPFGSGWGIAGWQEIVENEDGSTLLIDGDGSELYFDPPIRAGSSYRGPHGDFSLLIKQADGSFKRTMKDGTVYLFNNRRKLSLLIDSKGNRTEYSYDNAGQLTEIIDPVGLKTRFTYNNFGKVESIIDPANRMTSLAYDAAGNLIKVTDPDGASRTWNYDGERHMVGETDAKGERETASYDRFGRAVRATQKDGSIVKVAPFQTRGLADPAATSNIFNPPPVFSHNGETTATYVDGNGNVQRSVLDRAGQMVSAVDGGGSVGEVRRNGENQIVRAIDSKGFATDYTYDNMGNVTEIAQKIATQGEIFQSSGNAVTFDGINDRLQLSNSAIIANSTNSTVELWAKFDTLAGSQTIYSEDNSGGTIYLLTQNNGNISFYNWRTDISGNWKGITAPLVVTANQWMHIAATIDASSGMHLYINGELVKSNSDARPSNATVVSTQLGRATNSGGILHLKGKVDDLRIWKVARTQAEIQQNYQKELLALEPNLVGYWNFNEGTGLKAFDLTPNNRDGALVNGTTWVEDTPELLQRQFESELVYSEDFESNLGTEWDSNLTNNDYSSTFTRFSGRFTNNDSPTLNLNTIPGQTYQLNFDFYAIDSWEGSQVSAPTGTVGPDYFNVWIGGNRVFRETFSNIASYPQTYRSPDVQASLGFLSSWSDAIYRDIPLTFIATGTTTQIRFAGENLQPISDESWGIDNVEVNRIIPVNAVTVKQTYTYDPIFNRVTSHTDELGRKTLYSIDPNNGNLLSNTRVIGAIGGGDDITTTFIYTNGELVDLVIDPLGNTTDYDYDSLGRTIRTTYAKGTADEASESYEYDSAGNLTALIDARGNRTEYRYDLMNRRIGITYAKSTADEASESYEYDSAGNLTATTNEKGNRIGYQYDSKSRLLKIIAADPDGTGSQTSPTLTNTYDKAGNLIATTDPLGRETKYFYDSRNRLVQTIRPDSSTDKLKYDSNDLIIAATDPSGKITRNQYDGRGRVTQTTDALGNSTRYEYDAVDQIIATIDKLGNRTEYQYDEAGRQIALKDALGNRTRYEYDKIGNLLATIDANNNRREYGYDARNRQVLVKDALSGTMVTQYDDFGNILSVTDELGRKNSYTYDARNRQINSIDPLNHSTSFGYDPANNLTKITDAKNHSTSFSYDGLNRQTIATDPLGNSSSQTYDSAGNLIASTDKLGRTTTYSYDQLNRLTTVADPLGNTTTREYDIKGNLSSTIDPLGNRTSYQYDPLNRQIAFTDPEGNSTSYSYDAAGNLLSITDPEGNSTSYQYDRLNRVSLDSNQLGDKRSYQYDAVGNTIKSTDRNGRVTTYTYDKLNRSTKETWLDGNNNSIRTINYNYDAASQLTSINDSNSAYAYIYDLKGRLIQSDNQGTTGVPRVQFDYGYDAVDNLISIKDKINGTAKGIETRSYDELNRVIKITQSGNNVAAKRVEFNYDAASRLQRMSRFDSLTGDNPLAESQYSFNAADRLTGLTHKVAEDEIITYQWSYDASDRITRQISPDGVSNYTYDKTDQLLDADYSYRNDETYSYDANGNRTNNGYVTGANNRLLSDGKYNYTYDKEGNRTKRSEIATGIVEEYSWDYRNRLVGVVTKNSSGNIVERVEYTYDVYDRRIAKSFDSDGNGANPAVVERYVHNGDNLALVFDGTGNVKERFFYGVGTDQVLAQENANGSVLWSLSDNQGSVKDVVDGDGNVLNHINYDAFGGVASESNSSVEFRFGYTGRELDGETGLYYYRSRYYDPSLGRFISEDTIGFDGGDANLYRYVGNSPIDRIDPMGTTWLDNAYNVLNTADQFVAGFGDTVSFGATTKIRQLAYGDLATRNHEGGWFTGGQISGGVASTLVGFGTPDKLWKGLTWSQKFAQAHTVIGTGVGAYNSTRNILNGCGSGWDALSFAPLAGYAGGRIWSNFNGLDDAARGLDDIPSGLDELDDSAMFQPDLIRGDTLASDELLQSMQLGGRRTIVIAQEGSDEARYLDFMRANASMNTVDPSHILARSDLRKIEILEEFLHGTQQKLSIIDKLGQNGAEIHVKDFMIRHSKMLGLSDRDVQALEIMKKSYIDFGGDL